MISERLLNKSLGINSLVIWEKSEFRHSLYTMNENKLKGDGKVKYNTAEPRKNQMTELKKASEDLIQI